MTCPMCDGPVVEAYRPFCSRRCADLDLAKWLNGSYATPSRDPEDIEAAIEAIEQGQGTEPKPH
ncbi:MAG: DNA gyrase inhibitor YacG [Sulfitobacter sp.]